MAKIYEIYPRTTNKIMAEDLDDFENPLIVKEVRITGDDKKTVWLSFDGYALEHRCSKKDVFVLANNNGTNDTDGFVGKEVWLEKDEKNRVSVKDTSKKKK